MRERVNSRGYFVNITTPEILVFLPAKEKATGQAMLVTPGGSYEKVCVTREGYKTAEWLNENGIAAFVLKYRMPNGHPELPLEDGEQAMRIIREGAEKWGINPNEVGVIGFSAGGHFAANLLTRYTSEATRPNFGVLIYPVISMQFSSVNTREILLGANHKDPELRKTYSLQNAVNKNTPPTMLVLTADDKAVDYQNSVEFYSALQENNVPCEMHIFPSGGHGFWFQNRYKYAEQTYPMIIRWIEEHKAK
ncbi:MAG: alpha/beta hydrolase [Tidjanibacter sp.]|nr:alpha/beta hydrolase [Tidjanibacter sp.]